MHAKKITQMTTVSMITSTRADTCVLGGGADGAAADGTGVVAGFPGAGSILHRFFSCTLTCAPFVADTCCTRAKHVKISAGQGRNSVKAAEDPLHAGHQHAKSRIRAGTPEPEKFFENQATKAW